MPKPSALAALTIALILPLMAVSAVPAGAVDGGATFNVPRPYAGDAGNFRIANQVIDAIRGTPARKPGKLGQVITIATYLMDSTTTVTELIDACRRGVQVRVILDEEILNRNSRRLISTLNGDNVRDRNNDGKADAPARRGPCNRPKGKSGKAVAAQQAPAVMGSARVIRSVDAPLRASVTWGKDGSYVKRCKPSCRSSSGNMHMKTYLFSRSGGDSDIVMVSSSNLNRGGAKLGWNDLYVMKNRPKSYRQYLNVHRVMTAGLRAPRDRIEILDGPFTSRFFPIRDAGIKRDPVMTDLAKVGCRSAFGPTRLHISMFYWKGTRGNYIVDRLLKLASKGCKISIIYGAPSRQIAERLRNAARANRINVFDSRWDYNEDGISEVRVHSKFVAIRGTYDGNRKKYVVMTGSPNWVAGSLRKGDESTLNIELKSAYNSYRDNWSKMRSYSRRVPYTRS